MSPYVPAVLYKGTAISEPLLFGFMFGGIFTSFLFVVFRLSVRWKIFKKLLWDDAFVVLAWICFFSIAIALFTHKKELFSLSYLYKGTKPWTADDFNMVIRTSRLLLATSVLYTTTLWSIKISFLIFFRRIGSPQRYQRLWWWFVTAVTVVSYIGLIGANPYDCTSSDPAFLKAKCNSPEGVHYKNVLFYCHISADIATDVLIITIPVWMLWNVKMALKVKLSLMALFSLTAIVVTCAIVRISINSQGKGAKQEATWTLFWASLELTLTIIIACCGAFRQLFKKSSNRSTKPTSPMVTESRTKKLHSFSWRDSSKKSGGFVSISEPHSTAAAGGDDIEQGLTKKGHIVVSREVEVKQVSLPLKQVSRAHLAYCPLTRAARGEAMSHEQRVI